MRSCIRRCPQGSLARVLALGGLTWALLPAATPAEEALVAVATNFAAVIETLETDFERSSGHRLTVTTGSTGKLYAQIVNGAPFDVLLAADQRRPELLEREGHAVEGLRFTYAIGRLALWSPNDPSQPIGRETLELGSFRKLAIANPDLAPYGAAARETLERLGLLERLRDRIVMGENIGQTYAMVATGNADLGFVALAYVLNPRGMRGSHWEVPISTYTPIRQDAVLLSRAAKNEAAREFLEFLKRADVRTDIQRFGYRVE